MAKAVRVKGGAFSRAIEEGAEYLIVDNRLFLWVEIEEAASDIEVYNVTDPVEIQVVDEALADRTPTLAGEEARIYLRDRLREHGIVQMD